jgi:hypothetical protein
VCCVSIWSSVQATFLFRPLPFENSRNNGTAAAPTSPVRLTRFPQWPLAADGLLTSSLR